MSEQNPSARICEFVVQNQSVKLARYLLELVQQLSPEGFKQRVDAVGSPEGAQRSPILLADRNRFSAVYQVLLAFGAGRNQREEGGFGNLNFANDYNAVFEASIQLMNQLGTADLQTYYRSVIQSKLLALPGSQYADFFGSLQKKLEQHYHSLNNLRIEQAGDYEDQVRPSARKADF